MSAPNGLRPNNSAAILFLIVQVIAFTFFFVDSEIVGYIGSSLPPPPTHDYISVSIALAMGGFAGLTFWFMRGFSTPRGGAFSIQFPYVLHGVMLLLELAYTIYVRGDANSIEEVRENIASGQASVGALKISTAVLYMTTMLLFAKLASMKVMPPVVRRGETTKLLIVATATTILFLLKDLAVGSRGSLLNMLCFAVGGWTFARPITVRTLFTIRTLAIVTVFSAFMAFAFYQLTVLRAGADGLAIVHDTALIKFSSNLTVVHEYLMGTLDASVRFFWNSNWTPASEVPFYQFFPTLSGAVYKYALLDFGYVEGSVYYNIHENYPFNSASYMLRLFALGPALAVPGIWLIVRAYFLIGRFGLHMAFFAHCLLVYFAIQSFSSLPLTEIPFLLVPIFAPLFGRYFVRIDQPSRLQPTGLIARAT